MEKPSILIAGDSFTFGPYLPFYDSYPSILQRKLINWNIINAGVSSFAIRSEANIIKKNLEKFQKPYNKKEPKEDFKFKSKKKVGEYIDYEEID